MRSHAKTSGWSHIRALAMLERDLKRWLNNAYSGQLQFIEPKFGSTVGMPDVEIPIRNLTLPVELKIGTLSRTGRLHVELRPSQYHYHIMEAERGHPTAILAAVGGATKFDVYAFAGRHCEWAMWKEDGNTLSVATNQRYTDKCDVVFINSVWNKIIRGYRDSVSNRVLRSKP